MRTILLRERQTTVCRLPAADVDCLWEHYRSFIAIRPIRGGFELTPRGCVGTIRTPSRLFRVRPKLSLGSLARLLGAKVVPSPHEFGPISGLPGWLAAELVRRIEPIVVSGLQRGYASMHGTSPYLQGRLDFSELARQPLARADQFTCQRDEFTSDVAVNRWLKATLLLARTWPEVPDDIQERLAWLLRAFADVAASRDTPFERLAKPSLAYVHALDLVAEIWQARGHAGSLLVDLERAFERYVAAGLGRLLGPDLLSQHEIIIAHPGLVLRPDLSYPNIVADTKWKASRTAPEPSDLQQILAYLAVTRAENGFLIYPGRTFGLRTWQLPQVGQLTLVRLPIRASGLRRLAERWRQIGQSESH